MLTLCPECGRHYNDEHQSAKCEGLSEGSHPKVRESAIEEHVARTRDAHARHFVRQPVNLAPLADEQPSGGTDPHPTTKDA
jgi:hypothetical protein